MFSAHAGRRIITANHRGVRNAETTAMGIMRRSCAPAIVVGCPRSLDMYQSRPPVALMPAATTKRTATVSSPSVANPASPSSTLTTPAAIIGDCADHDVVGLDDVPQEAPEGHEHDADGEPSFPHLSHGDGNGRALRRFTLLPTRWWLCGAAA